ncbi:ArsR family transcriptional regulator [Actinocorallia herbida]|uniref:ArsR family transcriptional regulator n=1 Tax=Actinocorallia herbida TaxID=58109 RepID=A0A3N1CU16_9ACTN|nr:helix-turn-helix domain-containing protein [Actinocorallia herbida]ROO84802.1 ArsR family transcriptional regulator [Actinocorallia herbida]
MGESDGVSARLAALAGLLADETRARICVALLDGRAWTMTELGRITGVGASTVSEHLTKLVEGGLLAQERQGRHRYVRLADARAARIVEELAAHVAPGAPAPRTLRAASARDAMARARTCYDHLAGRLGVAVTDALAGHGLLDREGGFALTEAGTAWFAAHGMPLDRGSRRPVARGCVDWTERRLHLAGLAGAVLCRRALDERWLVRIGGERALKATPEGEDALAGLLGLDREIFR